MVKIVRAYPIYGSKANHLRWLLPILDVSCRHFVDLFGGSGVVLMNRAPAANETLNDLNGEVVNVFRQLRENGQQVMDYLSLTPYSVAEYEKAKETWKCPEGPAWLRAAHYIAYTNMAIQGDGGFALLRDEVRRGMTKHVSDWLNTVDGLIDVVERLKRVNVTNYPAIELIRKLDAPGTLFYADPPYVKETRVSKHGYGAFEMSDDDHRELAVALRSAVGKVAISGYECPLYEELYGDWTKETFTYWSTSQAGNPIEKQETVWRNYEMEGRLL